jgi:hypothetical protein
MLVFGGMSPFYLELCLGQFHKYFIKLSSLISSPVNSGVFNFQNFFTGAVASVSGGKSVRCSRNATAAF